MITKDLLLASDEDIDWEEISPKIRRKIMSYSNEMMLVKVAFEAGGVGSLHQHPHLQMSYVVSGVFELTIGQESKILKEGDVYFVPSNVLHGAICLEKGMLIDVFNPMREDLIK